ncbi:MULTISPECIES: hypothetical protein [unclassified Streptomyces]|uniref:hypothetical protein n=1 Tax=unclassified Streptomyces TaxID=2593676 RepID=UPI00224DA2C2|nr:MULTISPECIES: hypothetical protein [unclassified Streptomyces]MCX5054207.1 hypothetical protein [Streptomyces sp. NBC_00474]MCX5063079.1 hypothetical protein [Streptomyces sp. NBC_00452]
MSIWSSIPGPDILAVNGADDAANHRAEGEATITIDVATTSHDQPRRSHPARAVRRRGGRRRASVTSHRTAAP